MMNENVLLWVGVGATVLGTVGGALEMSAKKGTALYKLGVILASVGVDLASFRKLGGAS
jgi:hypothetical protein